MLYKSLNKLAPDYWRLLLISRYSVTSYTLRDTDSKLTVSTPRTTI